MDIQPVGFGPANLSLPVQSASASGAAPALASNAAVKFEADSIAGLLERLTAPAMESLLAQLGQSRLALDPRILQDLLQTASSAARDGDLPRILRSVTELVKLDPERGAAMVNQALADHSPLAPFRSDVRDLLQRLSLNAKADAHHALAAASRAVDSDPAPRPGEPDPRTVLALAERLLDAGPHINYVRAEELGKFVVAYYDFAPARPIRGGAFSRPAGVGPARLSKTIDQLWKMWRRAPVLLLLLAWFLLGLAGGILSIAARAAGLASTDSPIIGLGFETWGMGFLVLVAYGFYRSLRHLR